jgi:SAM-dependent methyltransferase
MKEIQLKDIDWNLLWQKAREEKPQKSKGVGDWDRRAASFFKRNAHSLYNRKFIALLKPEKSWTVLDIGCGPGTLALPLSRQVKRVTALDFSPGMLAILKQQAEKDHIQNISPHTLSWTDDWGKKGITPHDVTIASRSLAVKDLRPALEKLTRFATQSVIITDRVGHGPLDPKAFQAVGRELKTGPDYIYTINLLYQMGICATVDFILLEDSQTYSSLDEAVESHLWMFRDLTETERKRLKKYVRSITTSTDDGRYRIHREYVPAWAFIRWHP